MNSVKYAENKKQLIEHRRLNGLCTTCGHPANGFTMCELHREKRRLYAKNRRDKCCQVCGGNLEIAGHCRSCWDIRNDRLKTNRQNKKDRGECVTCNLPATQGSSHCEKCKKKIGIRSKEIREKRKVNGMCVRCGNVSVTCDQSCCKSCFLKESSYRYFGDRSHCDLLNNILIKQQGKCPYTGIYLVLGENTSLDHKIPRSRGGDNDVSNLQWVYSKKFDVNKMKTNMTDYEFRNVISLIKDAIDNLIVTEGKNADQLPV